ncbi:hypothetical protein B4096_3081 [Heyndrickxia coagulans]|nr:hypothetical protein B4096_3081 [Heyndrickxia coagulans]
MFMRNSIQGLKPGRMLFSGRAGFGSTLFPGIIRTKLKTDF